MWGIFRASTPVYPLLRRRLDSSPPPDSPDLALPALAPNFVSTSSISHLALTLFLRLARQEPPVSEVYSWKGSQSVLFPPPGLVIVYFASSYQLPRGARGRKAEEDEQKKEGCCRVLTLTSNA